MDADMREICLYLKGYHGEFVSLKEICRRAGGKRRFHEEPHWAVAPLKTLVERGIIETDSTGHYRLKAEEKKKKRQGRWVSPQIRAILEKSGKKFEGVVIEVPDDENAPSLIKRDKKPGSTGNT